MPVAYSTTEMKLNYEYIIWTSGTERKPLQFNSPEAAGTIESL